MKQFILFLIVGIFLMGVVNASNVTFTPIFCNDYEFTCCGGVKDWSSTPLNISQDNPVQCPTNEIKCKLESFSISGTWYSGCEQTILTGSTNCHKENPWYSVPYFTCQDERTLNTGSEFNVGTYIWIKHHNMGQCSGIAYIDSWKPQLGFCGKSGTYGIEVACGVPVKGADGCKFNPPGGILYGGRELTANKLTNQVSYTVPVSSCVLSWQDMDRHICGYKEESCSRDSDCNNYQYENKECSSRTLKTYGCRDFGTNFLTHTEDGKLIKEDRISTVEGGKVADEQKSDSNTFGKKCLVISTEQVQCCGDTDCGLNFFCDKTSFTCKENVECSSDTDCGVSIQCDWTTNALKKPICKSGKCAFEENKVGCCIDKNCQEGRFCNSEYKCQESAVYQDLAYNSSGKPGNVTGIGGGGGWLIYIIFAAIIIGAITFFTYRKINGGGSRIQQQPIQKGAGHCTKCGSPLKPGSQFCTNCGKEVKKSSKGNILCKSCGSPNSHWRKFCTKCGGSLTD